MPRRASRRTYNRVSANAANDDVAMGERRIGTAESGSLDVPFASNAETVLGDDVVGSGTTSAAASSSSSSSTTSAHGSNEDKKKSTDTENEKMTITTIRVIILDAAQTKFHVDANSSWTISELKSAGSIVHRVPPRAQRLIYMGKLLRDEQTLAECGIVEDEKIVHLFPKPNVVVTDSAATASTAGSTSANGGDGHNENGDDEENSGGAHIPQIVLDSEEAERRSQILILSSAEVFEAQHRVKLLSFILLIVCSMELLTLFTIMVGSPMADTSEGSSVDNDIPPSDPEDTGGMDEGGAGTNGMEDSVRAWRNSDFIDLIISGFGFYVATLGIKATTENTLVLARRYFISLVIVGLSWLTYYFMTSVRDSIDARRDDMNNDDIYSPPPMSTTQLLFSVIVPIFICYVCFLRAYQFQRLIAEAEREAEERTRAGWNNDDEDDEGANGSTVPLGGETDNHAMDSGGATPLRSNDYEDLGLQEESRVL